MSEVAGVAAQGAAATRAQAGWLSHVAGLKAAHPLQMPGIDDPRTHYGLISAVAAALGRRSDDQHRCRPAPDVGVAGLSAAPSAPVADLRRLGTMGFGVPAAHRCPLAEPQRTVVCFSGDGSILMNIQELVTAAEEGANVKIVLMNNATLGLVFPAADAVLRRAHLCLRSGAVPDFIRVAEGFGIRAVDLDQAEQPRAALARALNTRGRADPRQHRYAREGLPMVPPAPRTGEMIGG